MVELALLHRGDDLVRRVANRVIKRTDEITEALAYYQVHNKRKGAKKLGKLSKQLQYGIADAFNRFDSYQFAKYNRKNAVTLKDALFLSHPKPKDADQQRIFDAIVHNSLETPYTWEVELSAIGQKYAGNLEKKKDAMRQKWEELVLSGRLGYMAMLRNLRNMIEADINQEAMRKVCKNLSDPIAVKNAKQLPFRYMSAYNEISQLRSDKVSQILSALERAMKASAENIKGFDMNTRVVIAADVSGSMFHKINKRSSIHLYDIGLVLAMLLQSRSQRITTGIFGDTWLEKNFPHKNILSNVAVLKRIEGIVGYSTNGHAVIDSLIAERKVVDKVMFFTDVQMWDSIFCGSTIKKSWMKYRKQIAPNASLYIFDLAGYGQAPIRLTNPGVVMIAGWSNKIFDVLDSVEKGESTLDEILKIEI
jgi:hypothetical protein